jgi:EmrB/QacA subfamily drug resistance transporter
MTVPEGTAVATTERGADAPRKRHGLVLATLAVAGFGFAVLQSLVAPALPTIAAALGSTPADTSWIVTSYLLSAAVLTPVLGQLGDLTGRRRMMLVALGLLALGTLVAALSGSLAVLIVARVLQGAAGSVLPLSVGIVRDLFEAGRVNVSVGFLSAIAGIGGGLGVVAAGPVVDHLSWQWLFWLPLVLIVAALAGVAAVIPRDRTSPGGGRLDYLGAATLSVGLVSLLLVITRAPQWGWLDARTLALLVLGLAGFAAFVPAERRAPTPIVNLTLLSRRAVWVTDLAGLAFGFAMFGMFILIPALLELPAGGGAGFGMSVTQAGLFLLPSSVLMLVFGTLSGLLADRYGAKVPLVAGALLSAVAFAIPAVGGAALWQLVLCTLLVGAGMGMGFAAMSSAIVEAVPSAHTGEAMSVNAIMRSVGGGIGTAVIAATITSGAGGVPAASGFAAGLALCGAVMAIAALAAFAVPRPTARTRRR